MSEVISVLKIKDKNGRWIGIPALKGEDGAATPEEIAAAVAVWLEDNVPVGETLIIDRSLTIDGAAADAKGTGNLIMLSEEEPDEEVNRLWVEPDDDEVELVEVSDLGDFIEAPASPTSGQFLMYNGVSWVAQSLPVYNGGVTP